MKRVKVKIYGKVQGVFFRASTRDQAEMLDVKGYVQNMPDGTVEAVFEGEDESVDKIVEWCNEGSPAAKVEEVYVEEESYNGEFENFKIRYP